MKLQLKSILFLLLTIPNILSLTIFPLEQEVPIIRFAFSLSRTGAHSPSHLEYISSKESPNQYKDIFGFFWNGESELTNVGKRQQFLLGYRHYLKYIEEPENKLLNQTYDPREIFASSSESNRTIQSAYAQLHGVYQQGTPLSDKQIENADPPNNKRFFSDEKKNLGNNVLPNNILVIPVHTFYEKEHTYLLEKKDNCPNGFSVIQKIENNQNAINLRNEIVDKFKLKLIELIDNKKDGDKIVDLDYLKNNFDYFKNYMETFICNFFEDNSLIKGNITSNDYYEILDYAFKYMMEISLYNKNNSNNETKRFVKMAYIPLANKLINWLKKKVENDISGKIDILDYQIPKFVSYSSHHFSLDSLNAFIKDIFTFDDKSIKYPNFTSFINIELIRPKKSDNKYNEDDFNVTYSFDEEILLNIKYKDFISKINDYIKTDNDVKTYCNYTDNDFKIENVFTIYIILTALFGVLFVLLLVFLIHFILNKREKISNQPLLDE